MKFTKKMAAMIAGMMTIAAMGGMTAFADSQPVTSNNYTDGLNSQTATVDLQAKVSSTTETSSPGDIDSTKNDASNHIWAVTISADTLTWDLVRNVNTAYKQNITWNPSTLTYDVTNGDIDTTTSTYSVASTDTADKTVNVANNSNFAITSATTTAAPASGSAYGATFSVTNPTGAIDIGGNANTTITINVSQMSGFDSTDYVSVGTATITLTATGDIQTRTT